MRSILSFLGKDSGFGRFNTSGFTVHNNRFVLVDCGYTVFPQLQKHNMLNGDYDGMDVIITHLHPDHIGSLGQLAFYMYFAYKKPINIISACENLDLLMNITGAGNDSIVPDYPNVMYTRDNIYQIKFIRTEHVANLDCYGFFAEFGENRIVYTGDTATLDPFLPYVKKDTQFYVEASILGGVHLDISENLEKLQFIANNSAGLYLMHLDKEKEIKEIIQNTNIRIASSIE